MKRRLAAALLALGLGACGRARSVHVDLVARAPIADREWAYEQVIVLGTPAAEPNRGDGLLRDESSQGPRVWSRREGQLLFSLADVRARVAILDLEPFAGLPPQSTAVLLNDREIATLAIEPVRRRYRLALPVAAQQEGANRLRFVFREVAPSGNPLGRRVAAALYSVVLGPEGDPRIEDLLARGAPPPFAVDRTGAVPSVVHAGAGALRWAFRMPASAELRFTPQLDPVAVTAGVHARFAARLETPGGSREIWSDELGPSSSVREVVVPLEAPAGGPARVSLEIKGDGRFLWGAWGAPRILAAAAPAAATQLKSADKLVAAPKGVNVLMVILDAARADRFGAYGYERSTTPAIDRIAREGIVFDRAYTTEVYTLGAMASIWTSRYPDEHFAGRIQGERLPAGLPTLAELLSAHGTLTAGFVANVIAGPVYGLDRGFAHFKEAFRGHGSEAECFRKELWPWLRANRDRRFFAYAHFREPHFPYDPRPPYDTQFGPDGPLPRALLRDTKFITAVDFEGRGLSQAEAEQVGRLYDGNLAYADHELGALRELLEELGLWERTVVIVMADHGEALYEHGYVGHNHQLYEESVRIPLIVRLPGGAGGGRRVSQLVDSRDLAPTIAESFGVAVPRDVFAGRSLFDSLDAAPVRDVVFSRTVGERPTFMIRDDSYKLLFDTERGGEEFYDVSHDPHERTNLVAREPVRAAYYRALLGEWLMGLKTDTVETTSARSALTPEQQENLKALGYVQ